MALRRNLPSTELSLPNTELSRFRRQPRPAPFHLPRLRDCSRVMWCGGDFAGTTMRHTVWM